MKILKIIINFDIYLISYKTIKRELITDKSTDLLFNYKL